MDAVSGQVLFEKNASEKRNPASTTKIMTLVLALEDVASGKVKLTDEASQRERLGDGGTEGLGRSRREHVPGPVDTRGRSGSANDAQ
jgi:D-alanyl-D-alanine carboxypeptidase